MHQGRTTLLRERPFCSTAFDTLFIMLTDIKSDQANNNKEIHSIVACKESQICSSRRPAVGSSDCLGIWCDCLLARSRGRVMVGNQPPAPLLLYPHPRKASVAGDSLAFVLPNHC